jgi:ArsR family transcriptional regulator, arsenate/arsenite/antimonite-responsive transcriptional repressor / arsenate reductase (thioredoxin)
MAAPAPKVLKLAGHDVRWRLIQSLARTDQRVNELVDVVRLPQNLVSYHLRLLKEGDLVSERRSSADGRDVYYHLELDRFIQALADSSVSVHSSIARLSRLPRGRPPTCVLFICTGNSARSQIAEAMLRAESGSQIDVRSAGPSPTAVHPVALAVLKGRGIPVAGLRSKGLDEVRGGNFDIVVTLCDKAREACDPEEFGAEVIHWSLPDPAEVKDHGAKQRRAFEATADEIAVRIHHLVRALDRVAEA